MHIVDMVYFWARTMPQRPAIIQPEGIVTYATLAQAIEAAAEHFARNILDRSNPVAVSVSTGSKMLVASLGLLRAGFSVVPATKTLFEHLASIGANTLVCERDGDKLSQGMNILFDDSWLSFGANAERQDKPIPRTKTKGGDIICFTSGTTGRPKKVVWTNAAWEQRMLFPINWAFANYERILIVPGLSSSWGLSRAYEALHAGRTACFAPIGQPMLWTVNTYGIDTILASTQQILELAEVQEKVARYSLPSLKALQIGGSIISRDGVLRLKNNLCRNVIIHYASTEAGPVASAPYDMIADIPGAVGFVVPGVDVEIVDAADRTLPIGTEGFVRIRSPVFTARSAADESAATWFYPGDLGRMTENGVLCIAGRGGDVLNRGGVKLSITDLEEFLLSCPGVIDAGVCTLMGAPGFEEVWVGVVLEPSADMAAFRHTIESNMKFGGNIDRLFVVETIPRGTLGKIQREELKTMLQAIGDDTASSGHAAESGATTDLQPPD
jgi:acyl-coenzyme A synthetase/AMP-(fatty) acid ligase